MSDESGTLAFRSLFFLLALAVLKSIVEQERSRSGAISGCPELRHFVVAVRVRTAVGVVM